MGTAADASSLQAGIMLRVDDGEEQFPLVGETRIGRESDCEIQIDDRCVSRYHLVIRVSEEGVYAQDLMSTNGTYLNGKRLMKAERLDDGDELRIHDHVFRLAGVPACMAAPADVSKPVATAANIVAPDARNQPQLSGPPAGMGQSIDSSRLRSDDPPFRGEEQLASPVAGIGKRKLSAIERQMLRESQHSQDA